MNGQLQAFPALAHEIGAGVPRQPGAYGFPRLLAALLFSSLLHLIVVVLPYLVMPTRFLIHGGASTGPYALSAKLIAPGETGARAVVAVSPVGAVPKPKKSAKSATPAKLPVSAEVDPQQTQTTPVEVAHDKSLQADGGTFYPTSQLAYSPLPLNEILLGEPEVSFMTAHGGIILTLWIDTLGEVLEVTVETTDIPEEIADGIIKAFRQLHFKPGELNGRAVGVVMRIEVGVD